MGGIARWTFPSLVPVKKYSLLHPQCPSRCCVKTAAEALAQGIRVPGNFRECPSRAEEGTQAAEAGANGAEMPSTTSQSHPLSFLGCPFDPPRIPFSSEDNTEMDLTLSTRRRKPFGVHAVGHETRWCRRGTEEGEEEGGRREALRSTKRSGRRRLRVGRDG